jgi:hypothetical protein
MSDRFQLFRLSLLPRAQIDAFDEAPGISKRDYLHRVFSQNYRFDHYKHQFHYLVDPVRTTPEATLGRLGREVVIEENLPPEKGFEEISHPGWKACVLVVDPTDHADGQKASLQIDPRVGTPSALFRSLVRAINDANPSSAYLLEAQPIVDAESFWEFAEENRGDVTSLTFEFLVPNGLWSTDTSLRDELRRARETIKAQKVISTYKSNDGLETNSEQIAEAVDYVARGSGEIKAKARGNKTFSSTESPKTATLPEDAGGNEHLIVRVARQIAKVLGRE